MKKIILFFCMFFISVSCANALDETINYYYVITKEDINTIADDNKNINILKNSELEVINEKEENGILYGIVEYDNRIVKIDLSKVELKNKDVDFTLFKSEEEKEILVLEDTLLYNGPSKIYDSQILIPSNTILKYKYSNNIWAYVTYKGIEGWIYIYNYPNIIYEDESKVAFLINQNMYNLNEIELINNPFDQENLNVKIPKLSIINCKYVYYKDSIAYYYIIYNDIKGWYKSNDLSLALIYDEEWIVNSYEDIDVYEFPDINSEIIHKINKDEEYNILAFCSSLESDEKNYESWTYVSHDNIKGWIYYKEKEKENVLDNNIINDKSNNENSELTIDKSNKNYVLIILILIILISSIIYIIKKRR